MRGSQTFRFKEFDINQDQCAMKIGTDGVLIAAWTEPNTIPESILDIGAGTGVIALILAQRFSAESIDAIEIDENAYEQCVDNFENAPWADRLFCYHAALDEFADEMDESYDLIVSNPPFYTENYKTDSSQRNLARFTDALPFNDLLKYSKKLLSPKGTFALVIPYTEETQFITMAAHHKLYPYRIKRVKGSPTSEIKRTLLQFSFSEKKTEISELVIENTRHNYSQAYTEIVKDFYLKL